jgi:hypothetical protein
MSSRVFILSRVHLSGEHLTDEHVTWRNLSSSVLSIAGRNRIMFFPIQIRRRHRRLRAGLIEGARPTRLALPKLKSPKLLGALAFLAFSAAASANQIPFGYLSYDITNPRRSALFDITNQTGPNSTKSPDSTWAVATSVQFEITSLTVDFNNGSSTSGGAVCASCAGGDDVQRGGEDDGGRIGTGGSAGRGAGGGATGGTPGDDGSAAGAGGAGRAGQLLPEPWTLATTLTGLAGLLARRRKA